MRFTRRVVTASLLAIALSAPALADDKPLILLSVPGMNFPFFVHMMNDGLKAEADKDGLSYIQSDGQDSSPKQTADIEAALAKGVKGIVLSPREQDALAPALQEAIDAKVPVVTMVSDLSNSRRLGYVGVDNRAAGRTAGHLLSRFIGQRQGQVAMIAGSLSYRGHEERGPHVDIQSRSNCRHGVASCGDDGDS